MDWKTYEQPTQTWILNLGEAPYRHLLERIQHVFLENL